MQKVKEISLSNRFKCYLSLTKPGILFGNATTAAAGFFLSYNHRASLLLFLIMLLGISSIIGSACIFNNIIDRELDAKMERTKNRALVRGAVSPSHASIFGIVLFLFGSVLLMTFTNPNAYFTALFGFVIYVFAYSYLKYHTSIATLVGSLAGAVPPLVGYLTLSRHFDIPSLIFFFMIAAWQMPHFIAIAIYRLEDYKGAKIPTLPLEKGIKRAKTSKLFYMSVFFILSLLLARYKTFHPLYLIIIGGLSIAWILLGVQGFNCENDQKWARKVFIFSLVIVLSISITIPLTLQ